VEGLASDEQAGVELAGLDRAAELAEQRQRSVAADDAAQRPPRCDPQLVRD
jgi:hypothetical protein